MTLRLLQIIETGGPGGAETVFAQLASGLVTDGHHVHCLVGDGSWLPHELRRRGFTPELIVRGGSAPRFMARVRTLVHTRQIDLVHAHLFDGAMYAAVAARLSGVPLVATLHGQVDLQHGGAKQRAKHWLFRHCVTRAVSVSHALRRDLQPALALPDTHFVVVHNGIEVGVAYDDHAPRPAPPPYRLLALGNIRPAKDYHTLLRTVRLLLNRGHDVQLAVAGQPDQHGLYEALLALRSELQLEQAVDFRGFIADPAALFAHAHLFVLASSQEGFSLATIEAMRAGVPVVATRSGGPEEIVHDGETGLLVPPSDPAALADAIEGLLRDASRRDTLAHRARDEVRHRFSIGQMVSRYEQLYRDCLAR